MIRTLVGAPRRLRFFGSLIIPMVLISACVSPRLQRGTFSPAVNAERRRVLATIERLAATPDATHVQQNAATLDAWRTHPFDLQTLPYLVDADGVRGGSDWLQRHKPTDALNVLQKVSSPAAALLRAVAWREQGDWKHAAKALHGARHDPVLHPWVLLEEGRLALAQGNPAQAILFLSQVIDGASAARDEAVLPFIEALQQADPAQLERRAVQLEARLPKRDPDARANFLHARAMALQALGQNDQAQAMLLRQYIEEPVSTRTPAAPPSGVTVSVEQAIQRAQTLLLAHRNEDAIRAWERISDGDLTAAQRCEKSFDLGMGQRKLRHYSDALPHFDRVLAQCADNVDLVRRTRYLKIKVISIRDGLLAVPLIDAFANDYTDHSMVDDVLFWAGDLYQQRAMEAEARTYYSRAATMPTPGDYCAESRWRMAWMDYRKGRWDDAEKNLQPLMVRSACNREDVDRARASYWFGRVKDQRKQPTQAIRAYKEAAAITPLGFYGQLAMARLHDLRAKDQMPVYPSQDDAEAGKSVTLCAHTLVDQPAFWRGMALLIRGLGRQAAQELLSISNTPEQLVLASTHAASLGQEAQPAASVSRSRAGLDQCGPLQSKLLLALLLDQAGAHREAHWRIRTDFSNTLNRMPTARDRWLLKAAYPLAYRHEIAAAEMESGLPPLFLQALSREESAFDPYVVSWAGAYGLTQLLYSSGQTAARILKSPMLLTTKEDLLDPVVNARLGGALLGHLLKEGDGSLALALTGYNAGGTTAHMLRKRLQREPLDVYAESVTIQETRGYVQRVLRTYGMYRWLYGGEKLMLPAGEPIPPL